MSSILEPAIIEFIEAAKQLQIALDAQFCYFRANGLSDMRARLLLRTQFLEILSLNCLSRFADSSIRLVWGFWNPPKESMPKKEPEKVTSSIVATHGFRDPQDF